MQDHAHLFINGRWQKSLGSSKIEVVCPHSEEVIGTVPEAGVADIDAAVNAAREAFDRGPWPRLSTAERASHLRRAAANLRARSAEIGRLLVREGGFPIMTAEPVHVLSSVKFIDYYADLIDQSTLEEERIAGVANVLMRREPTGVVAALVPWNIPLLGALSKIAPALAAGCTVVLKPSPETPLSSYPLVQAFEEAGLPAGVLNLVTAGLAGSRHLVEHPSVDKVAFTGSTATGREIARSCAATIKRYSLELGGNAAAIVLDDAPVELVTRGLLGVGLLINNGQACIAQRRILVPRKRQKEFVEALAAAAQHVTVGDPGDPRTLLGPLISQAHMERVRKYMDIGKSEGATLVCGGGRPADLPKGWYVEPTIFSNASNQMRFVREEVFGPVVGVIPYDSEEEALAIAADTEYGLSSSVWSSDAQRAAVLGKRLRVGSVYINASMNLAPGVPFGGFKQSGIGREGGLEGLNEYFETQSIFLPAAA